MLDEPSCERRTTWILVYTKPRAEVWAEANMRRQGFATVLPFAAGRAGRRPLFPRYLFVGYTSDVLPGAITNTFGVLHIVNCGDKPARVPDAVIADVRARMDARGIVQLEQVATPDPLFASQERARVRALVKFAAAGFRVRAA